MKEELKTIGILAISIAIGLSFVLGALTIINKAPAQLGGVPQVPSYNTASTTVIAVGSSNSVTALAQRGGRGAAIICNTNVNSDIYLIYSSTSVVATTTASNVIFGKSCIKIDHENTVYTGQVEVIASSNLTGSSTAATSTSLIVTEFIGQ